MKVLEKYYNGHLGPLSDLYEARYNEYCLFVQFKDEYWFNRELEYYSKLKNKSYCYELIDVVEKEKLIAYTYEDNLNHILYENRPLEFDYKKEVKNILTDLEQQGIYKVNVYPHTFFVKDGQLKISDLYGCTTDLTILPQEGLQSIVNNKDRFKFVDGFLDCKSTYKYTLEHSEDYWPEKL